MEKSIENNSPTISVIVPVYNVESYICRCVDSILKQTFEDFELLLIDDGSPDNCPEICDKYALCDDRVRVIHKKNGGLSDARNVGLDASEGQWITFIDSDDWVHEDYLKIMYNACIENNVKISACQYFRTDGSEDFYTEEKISVSLLSPEEYWCNGNVNDAIAPWSKLYKKEVCLNCKFPVGKLHEDAYTTHLYLFQCDKIAVTNATLYYYFKNPNSITGKGWYPKRMDSIGAFKQQTEFFKKNGFDKANKVSTWMYFSNLDGHIAQIKDNPEHKSIYKKLKKETKHMLKNSKNIMKNIDGSDYIYHKYFPVEMTVKEYYYSGITKLRKFVKH